MWLFFVLGVPLLIVIAVFILTSRSTFKKRLLKLGCVLFTFICIAIVIDPSIVGIRWIRTTWSNYEVPNEFLYTTRSGFIGKNVRGITLGSNDPVYIVDSDYRYEIYTGEYIYEGIRLVEDSYLGYDAIGVAVYDDDELICKWILPSMISVDTLELVGTNPITLRVQTDEFAYEYIVEIAKMGTYNNGDESYYEAINEKPAREYYIPFNQGWIDRSEDNGES